MLALAAATALGALIELTMLRHWSHLSQRIPWVILVVALVATAYAYRAGARATPITRAVALLVALGGGFGVFEHVNSNVATGALDARYAQTWNTLSPLTHWWYAASGAVGPAPPLAPTMLALTGVCLALSTLGWTNRRPSSSPGG